MRLTKPQLQLSVPLVCEPADIVGDVLATSDEPLGITPFLTLPSAFGTIYLGETFTSYLSLSNHTPYEIENVVIKVCVRRRAALAALAACCAGAPRSNDGYLSAHSLCSGRIANGIESQV